MTRYVLAYAATGEIDAIVVCDAAQAATIAPAGMVMVLSDTATAATHYVDSIGNLVAYTAPQLAAKAARPEYECEWSNTTMEWVDLRDLTAAKADRRTLIRAAREADELGGFVWSASTIASDAASQRRILSAMACAIVAQRDATTIAIDWPLADGSYRAMDEDDLVALGQALFAHIADMMAAERVALDDIAAATTAAEVEAVVWAP